MVGCRTGSSVRLGALACLLLVSLAALVAVPAAGQAPAPAPASAPTSAQSCDRACLAGMITRYVDALVAHDPARLPVAPDVRFTQDSQALKLGEGLWTSPLTKTGFRHDYLDTTRQVAAAHVLLMEGANHIMLSVLLRVQDRRITGIETLVQRVTPADRWQPTALGRPVPGLDGPVPPGKRMARAEMIRLALSYTEGLRVGSFADAGTPFAPGTLRVENGVITAGPGCGRDDCDLHAQRIMLHPGIVANVAAVDEEAGVVLLWMNFGFTDSYGPGNALVTFEAFRIWGGEIHAILAFFRTLPLATPRFWPSSDRLP